MSVTTIPRMSATPYQQPAGDMPAKNRSIKQMTIQWNRDADRALAEAGAIKKPVLVDFSAAPN
jgi:hypothetical protein